MKRFLLSLFLLPLFTQAQTGYSPTNAPSGTIPATAAFRQTVLTPDSLNAPWVIISGKSYRLNTIAYTNKYLYKKTHIDSLIAGLISINNPTSTGLLFHSGTFYASSDGGFTNLATYGFRDGVGIYNPNGKSYSEDLGGAVIKVGNMADGTSIRTTGAIYQNGNQVETINNKVTTLDSSNVNYSSTSAVKKALVPYSTLTNVYKPQIVTTYAAAISAATGTQKKIITVTSDTNASKNGVYFYNGTSGVLIFKDEQVIMPEWWGWSTTATAAVNSAALQSALDIGGNIATATPGTFLVGTTHFVGDNTKLSFAPGTKLQKANTVPGVMTYVLASKAMRDGGRNKNITVIGNGLELTVPTQSLGDGGTQLGAMNGQFSFFQVDNLAVSGLQATQAGTSWSQYFFHLQECTQVRIDNIFIYDWPKDGFDIMGSKHVNINNIITKTQDDAIFIGNGWPEYDALANDCEDINISNWIDLDRSDGVGYSIRLLTGAWDDWTSGIQYGPRDYALNAGKLYRCRNASGFRTAANAPVQTSGTVTGADGITWAYVKDDTNGQYSANVRDIRVNNFYSTSGRTFSKIYQEPTAVQKTHKSYLERIAYNNTSWLPPATKSIAFLSFLEMSGYTTKLQLNNCRANLNDYLGDFGGVYGANFFNGQIVTYNGHDLTTSIDELQIDNCYADYSTNGNFIYNNSTSVFTAGTLNIRNTNTLGRITGTNLGQFITLNAANQWPNIKISNSTLTNLERLLLFNASLTSGTFNVDLANNTFVTPRYILAAGAAGTTANLNSNGSTFDNPAQQLFYNPGSVGVTNIYLAGSKGSVTTTAKVYNGSLSNYNFIQNDLPMGSLYVAKITPNAIQPNFGGDATGDLYQRNGSGLMSPLHIGSPDQRLTVVSGAAAWVTPLALTLNSSLIGTSYNSTAAVTAGLNLANTNSWSAIQNFNAGALITNTLASSGVTNMLTVKSPYATGNEVPRINGTNASNVTWWAMDFPLSPNINSQAFDFSSMSYGGMGLSRKFRIDGNGDVSIGATSTASALFQVSQQTNGFGTITTTATGTLVVGTNTQFLNTFKIGQTITANGETRTISAIASNIAMTTDAWTNANTNVNYTLVGGDRFKVNGSGNASLTGDLTVNGVLNVGNLGASTGIINLAGSTGGTVSIKPQASGANFDIVLPNAAPSAGQVLAQNSGNTNLVWTTPGVARISPIDSLTRVANGAQIPAGSRNLVLQTANTTSPGLLSAADWNTFNGKQGAITLTTTGTGAATLVSNTLNIPTPPVLASGTYTPTLIDSTSHLSYTVYPCQYMRVGNVVTVSGRILAYAADLTSDYYISLPIASAFTSEEQAGGTGASYKYLYTIFADAGTQKARIQVTTGTGNHGNYAFSFSFTYQIL